MSYHTQSIPSPRIADSRILHIIRQNVIDIFDYGDERTEYERSGL